VGGAGPLCSVGGKPPGTSRIARPGSWVPLGVWSQFIGTSASLEEQCLWAMGVLGPDFLHGLQGVPFCGTAIGETKPTGLHLLLPMEKQELWDLLT
jgi:hypothetical protein